MAIKSVPTKEDRLGYKIRHTYELPPILIGAVEFSAIQEHAFYIPTGTPLS